MNTDSDGSPGTPAPGSTRLVLLLGILSGLSSLVATPFVTPDQFMLASDVYYYAGEALLSGGDIYAVDPPGRPGYHYIYPPVVVLTFVPHVLLGTPVGAYAIQTVLNALAAGGIALILWRALTRRGLALDRFDAVLLYGFALVSTHSAISLVNGQVNIWLGFGIAVGVDALDRNRTELAGVAFGLVALVKVFPAVLGLYLLRRRAFRGVAVATAIGVAGLVVGFFALDPDVTVTYFSEVLTGRYDGFDGAPDPTQTRGGAQRQIAAIFGLGPPYLTPLAGLALAPVLAYLYTDIGTDIQRQTAILGTILVTLLFFPLQRLYMVLFVAPLVLVLYSVPAGRARSTLLLGALVSFARLDFSLVEVALTSVPLPGAVQSPLLTAIEGLFRVVLPPTLGMWLLLLGCVLVTSDLE